MSTLERENEDKTGAPLSEELVNEVLKEMKPRLKTVLGDTLDTYEEVIVNCTIESDEGHETLYNERDSEVPIYTTHERMVETCVERLSDELHEVVGDHMERVLARVKLAIWYEFFDRNYSLVEQRQLGLALYDRSFEELKCQSEEQVG